MSIVLHVLCITMAVDVLYRDLQNVRCIPTKAHDTRTRNSCELSRARNLYVCHVDLQQNISRASFSHQIERVLFRASFSYEFLVRLSWVLECVVINMHIC